MIPPGLRLPARSLIAVSPLKFVLIPQLEVDAKCRGQRGYNSYDSI